MSERVLLAGEEALPIREATASNVATTNGIIRVSAFTAARSEKISRVVVATGSTAAVTPTLVRVGVYLISGTEGSYTGQLVANSASDTTLLSVASTRYVVPLEKPFWKTEGLRYGVAVLVVGAATAPTMAGVVIQSSLSPDTLADPPSGLVMTGQADMPNVATFSTSTGGTHQPYARLLP